MTDVAGLNELCEAIQAADDPMIIAGRKQFVTSNRALIYSIDQLASAEFAAGRYSAALRNLEFLEEMLPEATGIFLRRVSASVRAGAIGALEELMCSITRLSGDNELFHVVEELVGNGRPDMAARVIAICSERDVFSPGILAASQSRVLATTGYLRDAIEVLNAEVAAERPNLTAMRCQYLLLEEALDFGSSMGLCVRTALLWGEDRDLHHAAQRLNYVFDFAATDRLLREVAERHPARTKLVSTLAEQTALANSTAQEAVAEHGSVESAEAADIFAALTRPSTPASRVLWGKQALVALIRSRRMTEANYSQFAWYLPSWEDALIRNRILAAAHTPSTTKWSSISSNQA